MLCFSGWLSQVVGSIILLPPDVIDSHLPCAEPIPSSWDVYRSRRCIDLIFQPQRGNGAEPFWVDDAGYGDGIDGPAPGVVTTTASSTGTASGTGAGCDSRLATRSDQYESSYSAESVFSDPFRDHQTRFTYGEVTTTGARQLFHHMGLYSSHAQSASDEVNFMDMGSGVGKLVVQAYLEIPHLRDSRGIELVASRHAQAVQAWGRLRRSEELRSFHSIIANLEGHQYAKHRTIGFVEGDLVDADLSQTTHLFVSSLCFPSDVLRQLEEKLCEDGWRDCPNLKCIASLRPFPNQLRGVPNPGGEFAGDAENIPCAENSAHQYRNGPLETRMRNTENRMGFQKPEMEHVEMSWTKNAWRGAPVWIYHREQT